MGGRAKTEEEERASASSLPTLVPDAGAGGGGEEIGGVETVHGADPLVGFGIIFIYSNDSQIKIEQCLKKVLNTPESTHIKSNTAAKQ